MPKEVNIHNAIDLVHNVPMQMKRRGVEMKLIITSNTTASYDPLLIKTVAQAHQWFEELVSGQITSLAAIASREGISRGHVSYIMNLAFLSPTIIEKIVAGEQPANLTAEILMKQTALPLTWNAQERMLGFN